MIECNLAAFPRGLGGAAIRLYNTLTRRTEPVRLDGPAIRVYACGITPYDTTHLGHAFTYSSADLLVRALRARRRTVVYVQNVTDIDDDILRRARETGVDWRQVGNQWTDHYIDDMVALNILPPSHFPRASEAIQEILKAVAALLVAGLAYESGGSVYYNVAGLPSYGRLSRLAPKDMLAIANERGNDPNDPNKRQPLDFVLWQGQRPGEPAWPSPWGAGRPGWHIECSSLCQKYLGETLDVHGGGEDLVFPHHESEIAQIEPLTGRPFAGHWMHTAMVQLDGVKMSKSLGNLVMVDSLRRRWPVDAIRVYLASHHYRSAWSHSEEGLRQAAETAGLLEAAWRARPGSGVGPTPPEERGEFDRAMGDDLDSPRAVGILRSFAERILELAAEGAPVAGSQEALRKMGAELGLRLGEDGPEPGVAEGWESHRRSYLGDG